MKERIIKKLDSLINEANILLSDLDNLDDNTPQHIKGVKESHFSSFKTGVLSFLNSLLGADDIYYNRFHNGVKYYTDYSLALAIDLLQKVKIDIDEGWLLNVKGLISAELFTDFLDMAEHLLDESYKDSSAVIIGSVLEENLRQLMLKSGLSISQIDTKTGKTKSIKSEILNIELAKNNVYNLLYQKSVTAWLDLRNKAAHGHYNEYDANMVRTFLQFVRDFATKFIQ